MLRTLILYESKHGRTEEIAQEFALILGPARCCKPSQFQGNWEDYEDIVICAPADSDSVDGGLFQYVSENADVINKKKVTLLCACLCDSNFNKKQFVELALEMKKNKEHSCKVAQEAGVLNKSIDDFINSHNTCALATGYEGNTRATPIEYNYLNGFFYILSEGGEKFANILMNPNVSLCIYNEFKGMNELGGMQITGSAELVGIGTDEYISVLLKKGLNFDKITSLQISLNMIKITIGKIEFLWSEFSRMGCDIKQIINVPESFVEI